VSNRRRPRGVSEADQLRAATRDQLASFARVSDVWRRTVDPDAQAAVTFAPSPLTQRVVTAVNHGMPFCEHLNRVPYQPAYIHMPTPGPMTVLCARCILPAASAYVRKFSGTREENTCDGCRAYDERGVHMYSFMTGPLMVMSGLCDDCLAAETAVTRGRPL
jgi:hypothetical protein